MMYDRRRRVTVVAVFIFTLCLRLAYSYILPTQLGGVNVHTVGFSLAGSRPRWTARKRPQFHHRSAPPSCIASPSSDDTTWIVGEQIDELAKIGIDDNSAANLLLPPTPKVLILEQSDHYLVASKPPSVFCHHTPWKRSRKGTTNRPAAVAVASVAGNQVVEEILPMVQRVRDTLGGRRVNLVHRLDRGASGCLLFTYADDALNATTILSAAMANKSVCTKTYVALVRGEGIVRGRNFMDEGWFVEDRPIKDEKGIEREAKTAFRFIAGQHNDDGKNPEKARASLVLARPVTGRWHQIRKHLNGLSHPILGDSTHGQSRVNREWIERRGMASERVLLHLSRLQFDPTLACPDGIDVSCPLAPDMMHLLEEHLPDVLREAEPILREEGVLLSNR